PGIVRLQPVFHREIYGDGDVLHHAGEHVRGRDVRLIAVDADHQLSRLLRRLDHAEAVETRGMKHDVAAALVEVVPDLDSLLFVVERARVRDEDLHRRVHLTHARAKPGLELADQRKLHSADESYL